MNLLPDGRAAKEAASSVPAPAEGGNSRALAETLALNDER